MLHRDASLESSHSLDISVADRLRVIEEPMQSIEWNVLVHLLKHIQKALDRFVVGCV